MLHYMANLEFFESFLVTLSSLTFSPRKWIWESYIGLSTRMLWIQRERWEDRCLIKGRSLPGRLISCPLLLDREHRLIVHKREILLGQFFISSSIGWSYGYFFVLINFENNISYISNIFTGSTLQRNTHFKYTLQRKFIRLIYFVYRSFSLYYNINWVAGRRQRVTINQTYGIYIGTSHILVY